MPLVVTAFVAASLQFPLAYSPAGGIIGGLNGGNCSMAELLQFGENIDTMTFPECLAYIARHRRKMDRLEQIIPPGAGFERAERAAILRGLENLERRIRAHPDCPPTLR